MAYTEQLTIETLSAHNLDNINELITQLLSELDDSPVQTADYKEAALQFLQSPKSIVFAAKYENHYVGLLTAVESVAIYANGTYGVIQELYVLKEARSLAVGHQLIYAVKCYAEKNNWKRLEVTTPDPTEWARTVAFYEKQGFTSIGLRLKYVLES
ncbi:MAG: GNAT family N-acetyltransferase [Solibacillus sp.]